MAKRLRCLLLLLSLVACQEEPDGLPAEAGMSEADRNRLHVLGYDPWVKETPDARSKTGVVVSVPAQVSPGYTLFASRGACEAVLLGPAGDVAQRWQGVAQGFWGDTTLREDGTLLVIGASSNDFSEQPTARYLRALDWSSEVLWQSDFPAHHDVELTPDGRLLTLTFVDREIDGPNGSEWVIDDRVVLASAAGRKLEEYSLYDLFVASPDLVKLRWRRGNAERNGHRLVDAFHANSVQWIVAGEHAGTHPIYADGNILVSIRHQNLMVVLDPRQRRLVWAWGSGELQGPHHARMLANGNITIFDNGLGRRFSRAVEVDPRTGRIAWQYPGKGSPAFFTSGGGSAQRLPNGNTLLAESAKGQLFEVTPEGDVVWKFVNPAQTGRSKRGAIHAAARLPAEFVEPILARRR